MMNGEVQKCETLGKEQTKTFVHATIRSEQSAYIIAKLNNCRPGQDVKIIVKRGALYFNTVYFAE